MFKRTMMAAGLALMALPGAAMAQGLFAENLLVTIPEGFVAGYDAAEDKMEIHELIPAGETVEDWSAMVTIQIFKGLPDLQPDVVASNMAEGWQGACPNANVTKLTDGDINGFPFTLWAFRCPLNPQTGKPETMYFKGISGSDAFYAVQYAFRALPADDSETVALTYLVGASACDTRKPERPCPAGI